MYFRIQVPKIQGKKSSVCCFFLSNNVNQFLRQSPFAVISSVKFENSRSFGRFGRGEVNWCGTAEAAAAAGADWGVRLLCRGIFLKILWYAGSGRRAGWRGECAGECGGSAIGGGGMTENPFRQGDELYAVGAGPPGWRTVCRMIFRVLLNLLNGSLAVLLLWAGLAVGENVLSGGASSAADRDLLLSALAGGSGLAIVLSTAMANSSGRWLGLSPVLISLLTAVAANAMQLAMLAVVIWYPAVQRGCFGAMAGLGEALMVLAAQVTGFVALISSGLLLWLNAPLRR